MTKDGTRLAYVWYTDEGLYHENPVPGETELNRALNGVLRRGSLVKASRYDYLTGLPSMTFFFELAEAAKDTMLKQGNKKEPVR